MKNGQKKPSSHSYTELSKTQFFPVGIVKFTPVLFIGTFQ